MGYYTAQLTIPTADNVAENYATNTLHFFANDDTVLPTISTAIKTAYGFFNPQISNMARSSNWQIKWYDDVDPIPRAPVLTDTFTVSGLSGAAGLPPEVALCVSFQGAQESGVRQARKRGRVYLPFLIAGANDTTGRPSSACMTAAVALGNSLLDASTGAATWHWVSFSKVAPGYAEILNGWVDNEFDTQRRRGRKATARTVFT
jgi:hypothetical protein